MSLLDKFKKNREKSKIKKDSVKKKEVLVSKKKDRKETITEKKLSKANIEKIVSAYSVIKEPCITEKASFLAEQNKYVFKIYPNVNKIEIKKAIELIYNTKVEKVNVIHASPKKRRLGRREGWRGGLKCGFRKAIITLKKGEKIELLPR